MRHSVSAGRLIVAPEQALLRVSPLTIFPSPPSPSLRRSVCSVWLRAPCCRAYDAERRPTARTSKTPWSDPLRGVLVLSQRSRDPLTSAPSPFPPLPNNKRFSFLQPCHSVWSTVVLKSASTSSGTFSSRVASRSLGVGRPTKSRPFIGHLSMAISSASI